MSGLPAEVIKYGYVEFRSKSIKDYRKRWLVLFRASDTHPARMVKYEDESEFRRHPSGKHIYLMSDVLAADRYQSKSKSIILKLNTKDQKKIVFSVDSDVGANDWTECIRRQMGEKADIGDKFLAVVLPGGHNISWVGEVELYMSVVDLTVKQQGRVVSVIPFSTIRSYQMQKDDILRITLGRLSEHGVVDINFQAHKAFDLWKRIHSIMSPSRTSDATPQAANSYLELSTTSAYITKPLYKTESVGAYEARNMGPPLPRSRNNSTTDYTGVKSRDLTWTQHRRQYRAPSSDDAQFKKGDSYEHQSDDLGSYRNPAGEERPDSNSYSNNVPGANKSNRVNDTRIGFEPAVPRDREHTNLPDYQPMDPRGCSSMDRRAVPKLRDGSGSTTDVRGFRGGQVLVPNQVFGEDSGFKRDPHFGGGQVLIADQGSSRRPGVCRGGSGFRDDPIPTCDSGFGDDSAGYRGDNRQHPQQNNQDIAKKIPAGSWAYPPIPKDSNKSKRNDNSS